MMSGMKKVLITAGLFLLAAVNVLIYWNIHLYYEARKKPEDTLGKTALLEKARKFYPFNDLVHFELGKAYFEEAVDNLADSSRRDSHLLKSAQSYVRSLRLNPASSFTHFHFAQTLLYMSYLSLAFPGDYYEEYRKAALLTGHNTQIFFEVGRILFSRWPLLSENEREFTLDILGEILAAGDKEKLWTILYVWDMNVGDYAVMDRILPEDHESFRSYAQFLGEKSLSLMERQRKLAEAEYLEFRKAGEKLNSSLRKLQYFQLKEAKENLQLSLALLRKINFYQDLTAIELIDLSEFKDVLRSVYLGLTKCRLEETGKLEEAEEYLRLYLNLEDRPVAVGELESYLEQRRWIDKMLDSGARDLRRFPFQLHLNFKQNKYRDITRLGGMLRESMVIVPESLRRSYAEILQVVGDAYQKLDYLYESNHFYKNSLELDPGNLGILFRMKRNYDRLNDEEMIRKTEEEIERLLSPQEKVYADLRIDKGSEQTVDLVLNGRPAVFNLVFDGPGKNPPLVAVFLNGRVVREDFLKGDTFSFSGETKAGPNILEIVPVNRSVVLRKLSYAFE